MLLVVHRPSVTIRILHCIRKRLTDELDERDQKEEADENHRLDMVHHVILESDKPIVYRLFNAITMRQGSHGKTMHSP